MNYNINNRKVYGIPDSDYFFDTWPVIIIALFWFPPIGIILLLRRRALHRRNLFRMGNTTIGISIFFFLMSIIYWIALDGYSEVTEDIQFLIFLIIINLIFGIIVLLIGIFTKLTAKKYRKYISLIVNRKIDDIAIISQEMKLSQNKVIKDLDKLISKRYLERYIIDTTENKIYLPEDRIEKQRQEEKIREYKESLKRVVECKGCGASNYLEEKIGKCQYCNSYIE